MDDLRHLVFNTEDYVIRFSIETNKKKEPELQIQLSTSPSFGWKARLKACLHLLMGRTKSETITLSHKASMRLFRQLQIYSTSHYSYASKIMAELKQKE